MEEYKILAEIYDILNPKEEVLLQRPFFEELVKKYSIKTVLDCACGTGIHLSLFDDMGLECFGSDISADMLRMAKSKLEGRRIQLKQQDFRNLGSTWHELYGMVACLTTSLPYMLTDEDLHIALQSMYDQLLPDGILVVSSGITDSLLDAKPKFIPARINKNDAFYFICDYTEHTMTFNILYVKQGTELIEHVFTSTTYNAMRKLTVQKALGTVPFKRVSFYGDYDFTEYDPDTSTNLIIIAQK